MYDAVHSARVEQQTVRNDVYAVQYRAGSCRCALCNAVRCCASCSVWATNDVQCCNMLCKSTMQQVADVQCCAMMCDHAVLLCYIYCAMMCNAGSFAMLQCCADVQWFAMLLCNVCNAAVQCFAMLTLCSAVLHGLVVQCNSDFHRLRRL